MYTILKTIILIVLLEFSIAINTAYATDPDINDDGEVNILDISLASSCIGQNPLAPTNDLCANADPNEDNVIDTGDLFLIAGHFGETGFPFFTPSDPTKIVSDPDGGTYPVNDLIVVLNDEYGLADIENLANELGGKIVSSSGESNGGTYKLRLPVQFLHELKTIETELESDPRIGLVLPNLIGKQFVLNTDLGNLGAGQKEAYSSNKIESAWELIDASNVSSFTPVNVAVSDDPIVISHQEFNHKNVINGVTSLLPDKLNPCSGKLLSPRHGTAVAGVIAAENDLSGMNGILTGINGVLGNLYSTPPSISRPIDNFEWIRLNANKFDYVNMSWGFESCKIYGTNDGLGTCQRDNGLCVNFSLFNKTRQFIQEKLTKIETANPNLIIIAAAGNNDGESVDLIMPAGIDRDNLLTVASTDNDGGKSSFSNIGTLSDIDIAATGENVYVPNILNGLSSYIQLDGTSFSTPMVTGVVGLLKSIDPNLSPTEIKEILRETGDNTDSSIGGKRLNAMKAAACVLNKTGHNVDTSVLSQTDKEMVNNVLALPLCGGVAECIAVADTTVDYPSFSSRFERFSTPSVDKNGTVVFRAHINGNKSIIIDTGRGLEMIYNGSDLENNFRIPTNPTVDSGYVSFITANGIVSPIDVNVSHGLFPLPSVDIIERSRTVELFKQYNDRTSAVFFTEFAMDGPTVAFTVPTDGRLYIGISDGRSIRMPNFSRYYNLSFKNGYLAFNETDYENAYSTLDAQDYLRASKVLDYEHASNFYGNYKPVIDGNNLLFGDDLSLYLADLTQNNSFNRNELPVVAGASTNSVITSYDASEGNIAYIEHESSPSPKDRLISKFGGVFIPLLETGKSFAGKVIRTVEGRRDNMIGGRFVSAKATFEGGEEAIVFCSHQRLSP